MNGSMWVPFFVVASADKSRRKRLADAMLPAMVPVAPAAQVAVAAVSADLQVRREDRRVSIVQAQEAAKHQAILEESVKVATLLMNKPPGQMLVLADLDQLPTLKAELLAQPGLLSQIVGPAAGGIVQPPAAPPAAPPVKP